MCEKGSPIQHLNSVNPTNIDSKIKQAKKTSDNKHGIADHIETHDITTNTMDTSFSEAEAGPEEVPVKKEIQTDSGDLDQSKTDDIDAAYNHEPFAGLGVHMAFDDTTVVTDYGESDPYGEAMTDINVSITMNLMVQFKYHCLFRLAGQHQESLHIQGMLFVIIAGKSIVICLR